MDYLIAYENYKATWERHQHYKIPPLMSYDEYVVFRIEHDKMVAEAMSRAKN